MLQKLISANRENKIKIVQNMEANEENLKVLVQYSLGKIQESIEECWVKNSEPFVSLSGKDSIIVLDLARRLEPKMKHIFSNTGLEWPSHLKFWKENYPDLDWVNAQMSLRKAYESNGAPIVSKQISEFLGNVESPNFRGTNPKTVIKRLGGKFNEDYEPGSFKISRKWLFLLDRENFPNQYAYSNKCCNVFKGNVKHLKDKFTFIGTRIFESNQRKISWKRTGCINLKMNSATPIALWPDWACDMYVEKQDLKLPDTYNIMKMKRTGCYSCPFPLLYQQKQGEKTNIENIYTYFPQMYPKLMKKGGWYRNSLLYMGVICEFDKEYMQELEEIDKRKEKWYKNFDVNFHKQIIRIGKKLNYDFSLEEKEYMFQTNKGNKFILRILNNKFKYHKK